MAQHGYLREYDEGWDRGNDRDRNDERNWRGDRDENSRRGDQRMDRGWRDDERQSRQRDNFMLGQGGRDWHRDEHAHGDREQSRHMGDRARSWFRDDDREYRGTHRDEWEDRDRSGSYERGRGYGAAQRSYSSPGRQQATSGGGDWQGSPRNFSSHQDDHYRSWRDRQMSALDQDYEDYCRERERQFHDDFDTWRRDRQTRNEGQKSAQGSNQHPKHEGAASEEVMELNNPTDLSTEPQSAPSPTAEATLGTNNSENSAFGRNRP